MICPFRSPTSVVTVAATLLVAALAGGCASTGAVPRPFPAPRGTAAIPVPTAPPVEPPVASPVASPVAPLVAPETNALVGTALELRGAPYQNGGTGPRSFDCSGFTQYVFSQHGIQLPRDVRDQFLQGMSVPENALAPGDLLFFATTERGPSHVAIAVGGDLFIHAPSSTGVVRVEHLGTRYWSQRFLGARRVL